MVSLELDVGEPRARGSRRERRACTVLRIAGSACLAIAFCLAWLACVIVEYGGKDTGAKAQVAIVPGAAAWPEGPSPVFVERLRHARNLYRQGRVGMIIVTGGKGKGMASSDAAIGARWLEARGVRQADIMIDECSRTTRENLVNAKRLMEHRGLETAILVSDPLHMRRATLIAGDLGLNASPSPTRTTRYRGWRSQSGMLAREVRMLIQYEVLGI